MLVLKNAYLQLTLHDEVSHHIVTRNVVRGYILHQYFLRQSERLMPSSLTPFAMLVRGASVRTIHRKCCLAFQFSRMAGVLYGTLELTLQTFNRCPCLSVRHFNAQADLQCVWPPIYDSISVHCICMLKNALYQVPSDARSKKCVLC